MTTKLTGKALAKLEAERDVWQEVLDGVREIKAGGGTRISSVEERANPIIDNSIRDCEADRKRSCP